MSGFEIFSKPYRIFLRLGIGGILAMLKTELNCLFPYF